MIQTPALRQVMVYSSVLMLLISGGWFAYFNSPKQAHAAANGDYRTRATGNWNATGTWQRYSSGSSSWVNATATPTNADGVITIQNGHTVTVTANVSADQVVISSGGQVTLNSGTTLTLANGSGTDCDVSGIFKSAGTVTINSGATIAYQSGGKYQHNFTTAAGTIPAATWNSSSTCEIIGYTSNNSAPSGLSQSFGNFTWNCTAQSSDIDLNGAPVTINGNLAIASTNNKELLHSTGSTNYTINVAGNYLQTGGSFFLSDKSNNASILNITGDYIQSGGTFKVEDGSNATGTVNVFGNWSHTGGTITVGGNGSTNAQVYFKKSGSQTFTASGNTVSGNVDFTVNSGSTLVMGTNILTGRNFNLLSGAGIQIGSATGIVNTGLGGANGNIQTSNSRNYNSGASYTYNGSAAQATGNGLPATVANLTVNNSSGITLSNTVAVSNIITLTNGKITTGALNELSSTNASASGVTGYSSASYVVGVLRRTVSGTGSYDFPVGTSAYYELANLTFSGATGFTNVAASFTNSNPVTILSVLTSIVVNALSVTRVLDYGYWTLTPNSSMTGGTYTITLQEKGYTPSAASPAYCVLKRANALSAWQSSGTHNYALQTESNGVVTAVRSGLTSFSDFAIGYGEYLAWEDPVLISGTDGQVGAVYKFAGVSAGADAWVEIVNIKNGASLDDIDHFTDGYQEAWQPFINVPANTTASILWRITYKVIGTTTDTVMPYLALTAIDVDGNGSNMKEYVEASNIYSYAVDPSTDLIITYGTRGYRATATTSAIANIDSSVHESMFQINHMNINTFYYETGVINNSGSSTVRQFSLYFKYFMPGNNALPIKLISFNAKHVNDAVALQWATAAEKNNDYFSIERSSDGEHFEKILTKKGAGTSNITVKYNAEDRLPLNGISYYRLKQTDFNGKYTYSEVITVSNQKQAADNLEINSVSPTLFNDNFKVNFTSKENALVDFMLTSISGQLMARDKINVQEGFNSYEFNDHQNLPAGIYFVVLLFNDKKASYKVVKQ